MLYVRGTQGELGHFRVTKAFYSLKEAAHMIGVHPDTVRKWLKKKQKNRPPARKIGPQRIGFPKAKFHEWLEGTQ